MNIWKTNFEILAWSAWAPGLTTIDEWLAWSSNPNEIVNAALPPTRFLNSNLRRRCSQLTRSCLETAFCCLPEEQLSSTRAVFGSRHGECQTSQQLLEMLAHKEVLSPMGFSLSVHNAVAGVFSIATKNQSSTNSISAGKQSFYYTLLDGLITAWSEADKPFLLCFGEELVPDALKDVVEEPRLPFSLAILLKVTEKPENISFSLESCGETTPEKNTFSEGLMCLRWLLSPQETISFKTDNHLWSLTKKTGPYIDQFRAVNVEVS